MKPDATELRQEKPAKSKRRQVVIGVCCVVLIVVGGLGWFLSNARERARRNLCMSCLWALGRSCQMCVLDNAGQLPTNWVSVAKSYANNPAIFRCRSIHEHWGAIETVDQWSDFILVTGLTTNDPPDTILAYERLRNHKVGGNVLFLDGSVVWESAKEYGKLKTKTGKILSNE